MAYPIKELPTLPAERVLKVIGGRWKTVILYCLFDGPKRLSELKRLVPDISQKVLIQALREMEEHGIVHREIFKEVPPRGVHGDQARSELEAGHRVALRDAGTRPSSTSSTGFRSAP
jgi:hypothetical protein